MIRKVNLLILMLAVAVFLMGGIAHPKKVLAAGATSCNAVSGTSTNNGLKTFGCKCDFDKTFFGIPAWYKYLKNYEHDDPSGACSFDFSKPASGTSTSGDCQTAHLHNQTCVGDVSAFVLIGLAIVDILLRLIAFIAVGFIILGGAKYILSQGEPDRTKQAQNTILNALIGVVVALIASGVVGFVGARLGS